MHEMESSNKSPELIIIAGPNGSGKTTITTQFLHHEWSEGILYINPDIIAQEKFGDWNSTESILKAATSEKIASGKGVLLYSKQCFLPKIRLISYSGQKNPVFS